MSAWLNLFSVESWREFARFGSKLSGFRPSRWSTAKQVQIGDILICYMIGGRGFFGIAEVTGKPFYDASPAWDGFDFASWIPLEVKMVVPDEQGIRPPSLKEFSWIKGKAPNYWKGRVAGSPARIEDVDAEIIVAALQKLNDKEQVSESCREIK